MSFDRYPKFHRHVNYILNTFLYVNEIHLCLHHKLIIEKNFKKNNFFGACAAASSSSRPLQDFKHIKKNI